MITRKEHRKLSFLRVFVFSLSAFIFNTTEFIPVALLSDIAVGFEMETATTGLMITAYAWVVFLAALPFMLLTAKVERKRLLLVLFAIFIVGHIVSYFATSFTMLLISRMGIALTHAIFWSITASLVIRVAPKDKKQQALGLLALGSSLAMIFGLPLGRMIGQAFGWRETFALIGIIALGIMLIMWKLLPHLPSKNSGSLAGLPILIKRPMLVGIYLLTAVVISGHFTGYSYIEPFIVKISQMSEQTGTAILLVFGLAGVAASFLFGRLYPKAPKKFIIVNMALIMLMQLCLLPFSDHIAAMFGIVFIWGIGITAMSIALQMQVLELAPDATDVATAIYSGIYNVGIGGGALIGSQVIQHIGLPYIGWIGGGLAGFAILWFVFISLRYRVIK
ncbi:sugar transporter [Actinobacillus pleuropneumoniae]|uniref:sugar transporter n=1 Tax=Actinobacillus pleuropneumoniae TaxID=715 RepID=UPI003D003810